MAIIWILPIASDGSIIHIFTIRSIGTAGITIRFIIHPGIHLIGRWAGVTAVGIHLITVGGGAILLTTVTGTGLIIPIMDTVIPIIRGMVMVDITETLDTMPIPIMVKGDLLQPMLCMVKMLPEEIPLPVLFPAVMEEIKAVQTEIPMKI